MITTMNLTARDIELLGERRTLAYQLREQGLAFKEVGAKMGITASRAGQLYSRAKWRLERQPHWMDGLSVRASNCLSNGNIHSRTEALIAFQSGRLNPIQSGPPRNYGWKTHKEVAKWLGLPEPMKQAPRIHVPKTCPHCGGKLT